MVKFSIESGSECSLEKNKFGKIENTERKSEGWFWRNALKSRNQ